MHPDAQLVELCRALDLSELAAERLFEEFRKLLLKGEATIDRPVHFSRSPTSCASSPSWLPLSVSRKTHVGTPKAMSGSTLCSSPMQPAARRTGQQDADLAVMFAALCHDMGKALVTVRAGARVHAHDHHQAGIEPTSAFMARIRSPKELCQVCLLAGLNAPSATEPGSSTRQGAGLSTPFTRPVRFGPRARSSRPAGPRRSTWPRHSASQTGVAAKRSTPFSNATDSSTSTRSRPNQRSKGAT